MKKKTIKTTWFHLLTKMTGMLSALAIIAANITCSGEFYQPVVPKSLQNNQ